MDSEEDDSIGYHGRRKKWRVSVKPRYGEKVGVCGFEPLTTTAEVKASVACTIDLTAEQHRLIFAGTELDDNITLASYGIADGSTLRQEALHGSLGGIGIEVVIVLCRVCPPLPYILNGSAPARRSVW